MALIFGCSTVVVVFSLISLAFLIIATITAPATSVFSLAEAEDIRYGVFGYCDTSSGTCVTGSPSYDVTGITNLTDWKMDDSARDTLVKILVVTPVAAGLTLISFLFNFFAHFGVFGTSLAFYLVGFVFTLLAFLAAALTVIITFLLFYPHVKWPAWILIGSAVLNLVSVPLVFFAMRTSPYSDRSEEAVDNIDDNNLTDLSDGDNFKAVDSFRINNMPSTGSFTRASAEKNSAIKVITDDSSLSGDHFEKVSLHDYSRTNPISNYKRYDYPPPTSGFDTTASTAYSEGTPNLVSAQNYNKAGAVREEAACIQPQSAKPETATPSAYPSAQYSSSYQKLPNQPTELPITAPCAQGPPSSEASYLRDPAHSNSDGQTTPYPHSIFQTTDSNQLVSQNDASISAAYENEYPDDINDNDSDFTSVSQRAANPRYYRSLQQQGPSLFPNNNATLPINQYQAPPMQQHVQQSQASQEQHLSSYSYTSPQYQSVPVQSSYGPQGPIPHQQSQPTSRGTSDYVLSHNPDFAIGGPAFQKPYAKKSLGTPPISGGYRPAYKKRLNSGNKMPAASLSADSPYNIR